MTALTIRLNDQLYDRLRKAAFDHKWSLNFAIGVAVSNLLDELETIGPPAKEQELAR